MSWVDLFETDGSVGTVTHVEILKTDDLVV